MMDKDLGQHDLRILLAAICDESISPDQLAVLEAALQTDPQARRFYLEYLDLHANLIRSHRPDASKAAEHHSELEQMAIAESIRSMDEADVEVEQVINEELVRIKNLSVERFRMLRQHLDRKARSERIARSWYRVYMSVASVAASLMLIAAWFVLEKRFGTTSPGPLPQYVATLQSTAGAIWLDSELPTASNSRLMSGTLQLRSGIAQIRFDSGAVVTIHGPATLDIQSQNRGFLHYGSLLARVPSPAVGFTIETPSAIVVDLGTEFGIAVNALASSATDSAETEVHVFEGEVDLAPQFGGVPLAPKRRLVQGEAARLGIQQQDEGKLQASYSWNAMIADRNKFFDMEFLVRLQEATATFSQTYFGVSNFLNPDPLTSWGIGATEGVGGKFGSDSSAVVETVTNLGFVQGTALTFTLEHLRNDGNNLGRFRISFTTDHRDTFADGLPIGGDVTAHWTVLEPLTYSSSDGSTITKLNDKSLLLSGLTPNSDTYVITARTMLTGITGFRLETIADPSLPGGGPGRRYNGNFSLTRFVVTAAPLNQFQDKTPVPRSKSVTRGSIKEKAMNKE